LHYWVYIIPSASLRAAIQPWASPWSSGRDYKISRLAGDFWYEAGGILGIIWDYSDIIL